MTSTRPTVKFLTATQDDASAVASVLTEAFLYSPVADWLIPDPDTRRRVYLDYFRLHVDHALDSGTVDVTADYTAAALWHPNGLPDPAGYDERLAAVCGVWLRRFQVIDDLFTEHHPATPHHYLAFLGVVPNRQGEGIGSALLNRYHTNLDAQGMPAYLEASTPRSRDLYLRHGYTVRQHLQLPEEGPTMWPMWREPIPRT
jgi:GNAT superfamily N-acetyltransferase